MGFVLRRTAFAIAGTGRATVAEVIDAHLEMLSAIAASTLWAVTYGWFEGTAVDVGKWFGYVNAGWPFALLGFQGGHLSVYHIMMGLTVFAITFSFGFLKFTRMLFHRKRYLMFTALGNYPYALALEDFAYFFFSVPYARLLHDAWTCGLLRLGCIQLEFPWVPPGTPTSVTFPLFIPGWYFVTLAIAGAMWFLAYRSALVNLLVTREVMKEIGFSEKSRIPSDAPSVLAEPPAGIPAIQAPQEACSHGAQATPEPKATETSMKVSQIVDQDREELTKRLRERLERGG